MAEFFQSLTPEIKDFISKQNIFFTATAPNSGRINLSPKGMDTFRIIDDNTVAYLDLTGSGNETSAHIHENQRITIMMCSFDQKPLILKLYGTGKVIQPHHSDWNTWITHFKQIIGQRQIIVIHVQSTQTSCGYGVPLYDFKEERQTLIQWSEKKGIDGLKEYQEQKNVISIDGLDTMIFK